MSPGRFAHKSARGIMGTARQCFDVKHHGCFESWALRTLVQRFGSLALPELLALPQLVH